MAACGVDGGFVVSLTIIGPEKSVFILIIKVEFDCFGLLVLLPLLALAPSFFDIARLFL